MPIKVLPNTSLHLQAAVGDYLWSQADLEAVSRPMALDRRADRELMLLGKPCQPVHELAAMTLVLQPPVQVQKQHLRLKLRVCFLPVQSPWLNPIEPKWLHGKRALDEPERKLSAPEVKRRVHELYHGELQE